MYVVVNRFFDKVKKQVFESGEAYPSKDVPSSRLDELSSTKNISGTVLIKKSKKEKSGAKNGK